MNWPTVAATGHRPQHLAPDVRDWVRGELARIAIKLRDECSMACGISGMALGTDLWWADGIVKAAIPLWAHVPFPQQSEPWKPDDRAEWQRLLGLAVKTTMYGQDFDVKLLHARNDGMLRASSAIVAVLKTGKRTGGTASAFRKAVALGMPIVHVNPVDRVTTLRLPVARAV